MTLTYGACVGVSTNPPGGVAPLQATVSLATVPATADDPFVARLTGRTTGTADAFGLIVIPDLVASVIPGEYNLSVTLTGFPLVCLLLHLYPRKHGVQVTSDWRVILV